MSARGKQVDTPDNEVDDWIDPFILAERSEPGADQNERDGVWALDPVMTARCGHDVKYKIARAGGANKIWDVEYEKAMRPYATRLNRLPLTVLRNALKPLVARLLVRDWEGFGARDKPLPCTAENVLRLLKSREGDDTYDLIFSFAQNGANYYDEGNVETDAKNS